MYNYKKHPFLEDLNGVADEILNEKEISMKGVYYIFKKLKENPNADTVKIMQEVNIEENEEKCKELFKKCSYCYSVINKGFNIIKQSAKTFKENSSNISNEFLEEIKKDKPTSDMLCKKFNDYFFLNFKYDIYSNLKIKNNNSSERKKIQELYENFTDKERDFVFAFLLTQSKTKKFFEEYTGYQYGLKNAVLQVYNTLEREILTKENEIWKKMFKFKEIVPNVFIMFLLKEDLNDYFEIKNNYCLEFDLKYNKDKNNEDKTILTLFFDIYSYDGNKIRRHKILENSCQGRQPIDSVIKNSRNIQFVIDSLTDLKLLEEDPDLFKKLAQNFYKRCVLLQCLHKELYEDLSIINYPLNDSDKKREMIEKGFALCDFKFIYFEKFTNYLSYFGRFEIINKIVPFKDSVEEYKDKINSNKLDQVDKLILINRIRESESIDAYKMYNFKNFLKYKINSVELDKRTRLLLTRQVDPTEITKIDKESLIKEINSITNLTDIDKLDLVCNIKNQKNMENIIWEIEQYPDKLIDKKYKENLISKINNITNLTETDAKNLIDKINSIKLDRSNKYDKLYKSFLIEKINPVKLNEEDKKNLIDKMLSSHCELDEREKSFLISEISNNTFNNTFKKINSTNEGAIDFDLFDLNKIINSNNKEINSTMLNRCLVESDKIYNKSNNPFKDLDELDILTSIYKLKELKTKLNKFYKTSELSNMLKNFNSSVESIISALSYYNYNTLQYQTNPDIWEKHLATIILKGENDSTLRSLSLGIGCVKKDANIEKNILNEFKIVSTKFDSITKASEEISQNSQTCPTGQKLNI